MLKIRLIVLGDIPRQRKAWVQLRSYLRYPRLKLLAEEMLLTKEASRNLEPMFAEFFRVSEIAHKGVYF